MGRFHTSLEYNRYLGKTVISRPDDQLLPRLDEQDDQIYVAPGEVYCRFRDANGQLCSHVGRFSRRAYLVNHYQAEHKLTVADNVTKSHSNRGGDSIVGWYQELMDGHQPSWRAKDQQPLQVNTQTNPSLPVPSAQNVQAAQAADQDLSKD